MKKICVVILFAFLMIFSYSPLANAEETVCRNIKDASTCASSTQNGGPCEWKAGEGENEGKNAVFHGVPPLFVLVQLQRVQ